MWILFVIQLSLASPEVLRTELSPKEFYSKQDCVKEIQDIMSNYKSKEEFPPGISMVCKEINVRKI